MKEKYITYCIGEEEFKLKRNQFLKVILLNKYMKNEDKLSHLLKCEFSLKYITLTLMDLLKNQEMTLPEILE